MRTFVILSVCVAAAMCAPAEVAVAVVGSPRSLPAVTHEEVHDDLGQYNLRYVTAEGTIVSERGKLVPTADGKDQVLIYEGEYSFIGDDGKTYITKYSTDLDGGYKVSGDHLPIAPEPLPVPEMPLPEMPILKAEPEVTVEVMKVQEVPVAPELAVAVV